MAGFINIGFGTKITFTDTQSVKFHVNQTGNCDYILKADALVDLSKITLGTTVVNPCPEILVKVAPTDTVITAINKLQCAVTFILDNCCGGGGGTGTVTNVSAGNLNPLFTTSVATPTTTPVISFAQISQNQNLVFASPDGSAGLPIFRPLVVADISNPKDITSSDGSVILGGTPIGSVLQNVDLTVNPAILVVSRPDTEIFFGTGTSYSSNPNWTYNDHYDNFGNTSNVLQMLDPNTGNQMLYVRTDDGTDTSTFILTADNFTSSGYYVQMLGDINGRWSVQSYASSSQKVQILVEPNDAVNFPHSFQILIDAFQKAQFTTDSFNLRKFGDNAAVATYALRWYELNINGNNSLGLKAPTSLAGDVTWILPSTDSTGTQALVSDGAGNLSWASFGTGSGTVTSVSVVTNQGVSGSVATATTTPAITLSLGALTGVTSINGLVITANTGVVTTGTWSATTIATTKGGTGLTSYVTGDTLYASAANVLSKLAIGSNGDVLTVAGGVPSWVTPTTFTVGNDKQIIYNNSGTLTSSADIQFDYNNAQILLANGTKNNPSYAFVNDPSTGMFLGGAGSISFATSGTDAWGINSSQVLYPITDCQNIGIAGTNRIGTIYMCSNIDYVTNMNFTVGGVDKFVIDNTGAVTTGIWGGTTISVASGGTGIASYAVGDIIYASGATVLSKLADVAVGSYLRSGGVTTAPLWSTLILPNAATSGRVVIASATNTYGESANLTFATATLTLGVATSAQGILALAGATSGTASLQANATAGTPTITLPDTTTVLVGYAKAGTFTTAQTFNDQTLLFRNPANTFSYTIVAAAIAAARSLILPLTTQTETIAVVPQTVQSSPSDPTGTTSTTGVMMGLAGAITPRVTGKILILITGDISNDTGDDGAQVQIRYGTGVAPSNGGILAGTTAGGLVKSNTTVSGAGLSIIKTPFALQAIVSGLTVGTAHWIDVGLAAITAGTANIRDVSVTIFEL